MIGTGMPHFVSNSIGFLLHVYQYDVETYISICARIWLQELWTDLVKYPNHLIDQRTKNNGNISILIVLFLTFSEGKLINS